MRLPPEKLDGATVLMFADLAETHATGSTRHFLGNEPAPAFTAIAIAQYDGEPEHYLFYCDDEWTVVTDTCHDSIDAAMRQAASEFEGLDWSS